jgi:hypothetical protein
MMTLCCQPDHADTFTEFLTNVPLYDRTRRG